MLPPSANSGPLYDVFRAKVTSLIQEQLKPVVTELAAQQQTLLTHISLLKHNHNVNSYQMARLENLRDLGQSVNFKVTGVLGFEPWQHPNIGTDLREPVPADPRAVPQFRPVTHATREQRSAESAALIAEAGVSARRLGVPLTMQEFPRESASVRGTRAEDPMHAAVPLYGLAAPRWRELQGLEPHKIPGTAAYNGVVVRPTGKRGLRLYNKQRRLKVPLWKRLEDSEDPFAASGSGSSSSSSGPVPGTSGLGGAASAADALTVEYMSASWPPPLSFLTSSERRELRTMATFDSTSSSLSGAPTDPAVGSTLTRSTLSRTSTMATIGSMDFTPGPAAARSTLSRTSTMATIGSPFSSPGTPTTTMSATARAKAKEAAGQQHDGRATAGPSASSASSSSTARTTWLMPDQPMPNRGRPTAEHDDSGYDNDDRYSFVLDLRSRSGSDRTRSHTHTYTQPILLPAANLLPAAEIRPKAKKEDRETTTDQPMRTTLKRGRPTAELDDSRYVNDDDYNFFLDLRSGSANTHAHTQPVLPPAAEETRPMVKDEDREDDTPGQGQELPRKRLKRSAAPSPSPTVALGPGDASGSGAGGGGDDEDDGGETAQKQPRRRSSRLSRATAAAAAAAAKAEVEPAPPRGRASKKGKKKARS
ncbi:hypothetical protein BC826DRAFT_967152 [Russula brevipes]|nr:hypothetical protein BC826DRAFT_967152 [Russula brevipes]